MSAIEVTRMSYGLYIYNNDHSNGKVYIPYASLDQLIEVLSEERNQNNMTKKDFIAFANILGKNKGLYDNMDLKPWGQERERAFRDGALHALHKIEADLVELFRNENERFDQTRFRTWVDKVRSEFNG